MATNAIFQTPDIFFQGGQLLQNANSRIFDAISQAADMYQRQQMQREANLSEERRKQMEIDAKKALTAQELARDPQQILAQAIQGGVESLTPQQRALFEANQKIEAANVAIQPATGQAYNPYPAIDLNNLSGSAAPSSLPSLPQPSPVADMLLPPRTDGSVGSASDFNRDMGTTLPAPTPIGASEEKTTPVDTTGVGSTPVGKMKRFEAELAFEAKKQEEALKLGQERAVTDKTKGTVQNAIDRMMAINEELKKAGKITSGDGSFVGNAANLAKGTPYVGRTTERAADTKAAALRDEYESLRSMLMPFYAKASGLSASGMNSDSEMKNALKALGDPNGIYETNKNQLETLSKTIGTGSKKSEEKPSTTYKDGQTVTNPKTGEKMIYRGGSWQKM